MTPSPSAAETIQQVCYQTHPSVVPADAICLECLTLALDAERARVWEEAATVADEVGRRYAEKDESPPRSPTAETCAAVACAVHIASDLRARAAAQGRR